MKLTSIAGITLGKGQGKVQLQNQTSEPIEAGTSHLLILAVGDTKTGISKPTTEKGTILAIGESKTDYTLTLSQAIEPNETIEIDFTVPITVKKEIVVSVTTEAIEPKAIEPAETPKVEENEPKTVEETDEHPDAQYWWYGGK